MTNALHRFATVAGAFSLLCGQMFASSHSDAPLSKQDPQTNLTDVYGFITPNNTLTIVVSCRPFSEPGDGVMYERFADDALYSINIANPVTGALLKTYNFQFSPVASDTGNYKNKNTILSYGRGTAMGAISVVGGPQQNFTQTYSVTAVDALTTNSTVLGFNFTVPPPNTGSRITPSYNGSPAALLSPALQQRRLWTHIRNRRSSRQPRAKKFSPVRGKTVSSPTPLASSICSTRAFWVRTDTARPATAWMASRVTTS